MKMHCYFLLNIKHGPHRLAVVFVGGRQLSSVGIDLYCQTSQHEGHHVKYCVSSFTIGFLNKLYLF